MSMINNVWQDEVQFYNFSKLFPSASNLIHFRQLLQCDREPRQLEVRAWIRDERGWGSREVDGGEIEGRLSQYWYGDGELEAGHTARPGQPGAGWQGTPAMRGLVSRTPGENIGERTREKTVSQAPLNTFQSTSIGKLDKLYINNSQFYCVCFTVLNRN